MHQLPTSVIFNYSFSYLFILKMGSVGRLTSRWFTFMYSQIRIKTSDWSISLAPTPKKFASASDIIREGPGSVLFVLDSTATLGTLGFLGTDCSESTKTSNP